jgi:hypothetical protein
MTGPKGMNAFNDASRVVTGCRGDLARRGDTRRPPLALSLAVTCLCLVTSCREGRQLAANVRRDVARAPLSSVAPLPTAPPEPDAGPGAAAGQTEVRFAHLAGVGCAATDAGAVWCMDLDRRYSSRDPHPALRQIVAPSGSDLTAIRVFWLATPHGARWGRVVRNNGDVEQAGGAYPSTVQTVFRDAARIADGIGSGEEACAVTSKGETWCWRSIDGVADPPVRVDGVDDVLDLSVGGLWACAVRAGSRVTCWPTFSFAPTARADRVGKTSTVTIPGVRRVAVGGHFACALSGDGAAWCWGDNTLHQTTPESVRTVLVPLRVPGVTGADGITAGWTHACAWSTSEVTCWGENTKAQVGTTLSLTVNDRVKAPRHYAPPTRVAGLPEVSEVMANWYTTCALSMDGRLWCWGSNGGNADRHVPHAHGVR